MEISDYLRTIGKRAWLLALIPALAGIIAAIITITQPAAFRTTATLQLPRDENASPQQVAQQFVDFRAAANNNVTIERVADETGAATRKVRKVRIEQIGQSNFVSMSYVDRVRDAEQARAIMTSLAEESLVTLNDAAIARAATAVDAQQATVDQLSTDVEDLQNQLNGVYGRVGTTQLADEQRTVRSQQATYQDLAVRARAQGLNAEAQAYEEAAAALQPRIDDLRFALAEEAALRPQLDDARASLRTAQNSLAQAESSATSIEPTVNINFNAEASPVRRKARTARLAGAAVLAGIPVAVALILLLDLVSRRRRRDGGEPEPEDAYLPEPEPETGPGHEPSARANGVPAAPEPAEARSPNGAPAGRPAGLSLRDDRGHVGSSRRRRPTGARATAAETALAPEPVVAEAAPEAEVPAESAPEAEVPVEAAPEAEVPVESAPEAEVPVEAAVPVEASVEPAPEDAAAAPEDAAPAPEDAAAAPEDTPSTAEGPRSSSPGAATTPAGRRTGRSRRSGPPRRS